MNAISTYDALIVGGGPAGSTCASILVQNGINTLLLDKANFPRVKLCAGWVSEPIWNVLGISPKEYTREIWEWKRAHINFRGRKYTKKSHGYFIRRYEFDDFLLKRSKVPIVEGHTVKSIKRDSDGYWVIDDRYRGRFLIGAGGSHCPVARALFPKPKNLQCGTQEREFEGNIQEIKEYRTGDDGEPEILLHDDMKGYSWNVPKGHWLNVGTGTKVAREVLPAWRKARAFFEGNGTPGTIPLSSRPMLDKMKGHGYVGFKSNHLKACQADNVFLIGDALGLAQPMTGEGILPAVLSGKLCATAIVNGVPETYAKKLRTHPIISDYRLLHSLQPKSEKRTKNRRIDRNMGSKLLNYLIVTVFAFLFSAKRIPGSRIIAKMRK